MVAEFFRLAVRNIRYRRRRSVLTTVGIFIGITAVVALISIGQGMQLTIDEEFSKIGYNTLMVFPGLEAGFQGGLPLISISFGEADVDTVQRVAGVEEVQTGLFKVAEVDDGFSQVIGASQRVIDMLGGLELTNGRMFRGGFEVVLGNELAKDLNRSIGETLTIEGKAFEVVGVLKRTGNPQNDVSIFLAIEAVQALFDSPGEASMIVAQAARDADIAAVVTTITEALTQTRGRRDFNIQTAEQLKSRVERILGYVQAFLAGLAGISLLVGGVGVMNTMYTAVLERTREIGVMKAVGAKGDQILALFLIESGLLGIIGGIIGVVVGLALSNLTALIVSIYVEGSSLHAANTPELIGGALLFSLLLGSIAGLWPARRAAQLEPVEALRQA
ncbi:MAG: ABC transporter permease [Candidatus Bipolaricaulia bacterium]